MLRNGPMDVSENLKKYGIASELINADYKTYMIQRLLKSIIKPE